METVLRSYSHAHMISSYDSSAPSWMRRQRTPSARIHWGTLRARHVALYTCIGWAIADVPLVFDS
eukprot:312276-Amphidinium_carterae.1